MVSRKRKEKKGLDFVVLNCTCCIYSSVIHITIFQIFELSNNREKIPLKIFEYFIVGNIMRLWRSITDRIYFILGNILLENLTSFGGVFKQQWNEAYN